MSLYHEAAQVLHRAHTGGGSLKSLVFGTTGWKSDGRALFALATETAKWSRVLAEVVERSGVLGAEKGLTPTLALLLVHDLLLSKKGIALPPSHGLRAAVTRHQARLSAELTKARLRRGLGSVDELRRHVDVPATAARPGADADAGPGETPARHPRWIRVNTLKTTVEHELRHGSLSGYTRVSTLDEIARAPPDARSVHVDTHIPNLLAVATPDEPTSFPAYKTGKLVLQEKASCFPAYLLDPTPGQSKAVDGCAAPGNKTTHLAAILGPGGGRVIACERDAQRAQTLSKMVALAGAEGSVEVKARQDFTRLDPHSPECADVTDLLLDPSCSGSGILGRDEVSVTLHLPSSVGDEDAVPKGRKRKRGGVQVQRPRQPAATGGETVEVETTTATTDAAPLPARLQNLSRFQLRIVEHAMSFPAARRIAYSTCSVHAEENEHVVVRALASDVARRRGWTVLPREHQVHGLRVWPKRGSREAVRAALLQLDPPHLAPHHDPTTVADACIRCDKGGEDATMGFFVVAFARDPAASVGAPTVGRAGDVQEKGGREDEDEWNGVSSGDERER